MRSRVTTSVLKLIYMTALIFSTSGSSGVAAAVESSGGDDAAMFVASVNQLRTELGLAPLAVHSELTEEAVAWTEVMSTNDQLAHSADITAGISAPWIVLGENVGHHEIHEIEELFQAFVSSPSHYENLVEPRYQYIGVGVVVTPNGEVWTTHRFMAVGDPADDQLGAVSDPADDELAEERSADQRLIAVTPCGERLQSFC